MTPPRSWIHRHNTDAVLAALLVETGGSGSSIYTQQHSDAGNNSHGASIIFLQPEALLHNIMDHP